MHLLLNIFVLLRYRNLDPEKVEKYMPWTIIFWAVIIYMSIFIYNYQKAKNKSTFFKSSFVLNAFLPVIIILVIFALMNLINPSPQIENRTYNAKNLNGTPYYIDSILSSYDKQFSENVNKTDFVVDYIYFLKANTKDFSDKLGPIEYSVSTILNSEFQEYKDLACLNMAYIKLCEDSLGEAQFFLNKIQNKNIKNVNFIKGILSLSKQDTSAAIFYLEREVELYKANSVNSIKELSTLFLATENYKKMYFLVQNYRTNVYYPARVMTLIFIFNYDPWHYFQYKIAKIVKIVSLKVITISFIISLIWLFYLYKIDFYEKESYRSTLLIFFLGALFSFFALPYYDVLKYYYGFSINGLFINDLFYSIFGIGFIEELVKLLPFILLFLFNRRKINEPYDVLYFSCVSALGFAFVENLYYLTLETPQIIQGRLLFSVIGHMCDTAIVSYGFVLILFRYSNQPLIAKIGYVLFYFFLGIIYHALYDVFLFHHMFIFTFFILLIEITWFKIIINNSLNNSPFFSYEKYAHRHRIEIYLTLTTVSMLALQYVINVVQYGVLEGNKFLMNSIVGGAIIIPFLVYKLSRLDLIKGFWFGYYGSEFKKYVIYSNGEKFINTFFGTSISPKNYVGVKLKGKPTRHNEILKPYITDFVMVQIVDRCVVKQKDIYNKLNDNPYWFKISFETPVLIQGYNIETAYMIFTRNSIDLYENNSTEAKLYLSKDSQMATTDSKFYYQLLYLGNIQVRPTEQSNTI